MKQRHAVECATSHTQELTTAAVMLRAGEGETTTAVRTRAAGARERHGGAAAGRQGISWVLRYMYIISG